MNSIETAAAEAVLEQLIKDGWLASGPELPRVALRLARALRGYTVNHPFQHKALADWDRMLGAIASGRND